MEFKEHSLGLHVHDAAASKDNILNETVNHYSFLSTVVDNKENYSSRELNQAMQALDLYHHLGRPSKAAYLRILNENLIHNSVITAADTKLAFHIYGKDPTALMGKTRRQKPPVVPKLLFVSLPDSILKLHKDDTVFTDIFLINGI